MNVATSFPVSFSINVNLAPATLLPLPSVLATSITIFSSVNSRLTVALLSLISNGFGFVFK